MMAIVPLIILLDIIHHGISDWICPYALRDFLLCMGGRNPNGCGYPAFRIFYGIHLFAGNSLFYYSRLNYELFRHYGKAFGSLRPANRTCEGRTWTCEYSFVSYDVRAIGVLRCRCRTGM